MKIQLVPYCYEQIRQQTNGYFRRSFNLRPPGSRFKINKQKLTGYDNYKENKSGVDPCNYQRKQQIDELETLPVREKVPVLQQYVWHHDKDDECSGDSQKKRNGM
ncbi:hypothetical protein SBA1_190094 [Candidatus Sulfotelmatobacter kueseliae]|uniref:Uncharacterized protein n=1 Tax=Candidatus Sulfotelmatobacter kueseliae TaxID=2042962 RepID=A0A2U3KEB4_9BACT|nr:hypothetical protein SBA1_190094 [Candidatus Sulfotelmatobacter kueseliae]